MKSSNTIAEQTPKVDAPAQATLQAVDGGSPTQALAPAPFELLATGETFGVCDLDGECR